MIRVLLFYALAHMQQASENIHWRDTPASAMSLISRRSSEHDSLTPRSPRQHSQKVVNLIEDIMILEEYSLLVLVCATLTQL